MAADGSIRIVTKIDINDAKFKLKQLQAELKRADKAVETAQKNLAKNASKMAAYQSEKAGIAESTNLELMRAETEEQVNNVLAIEQAQLEALDQKYASVLETQRQQEAALEEAKRTQAQLNEEVREQVGVVQNLTATQERQTQEAKEAAQAEREKARAIKETERASKQFETSAHRVGRKILSWGTAMLAVRGVMGILRKSVNAFMNDNQAVANQIASIWSTLGAALAPIINRIVSLITTAVSIVAAFIKALTGIDIVANANAKALENQAGATAGAGSAAEKAEKQLAGFDEMNKLSDTSASSGGGGGGGGIDTANLFEPTELSEKTMAQIQWVADHFKDLLWYAGAIGAAIATWKIAGAFTKNLKTIWGLVLAVAGSVLLVKGYIDAWNEGIDLQNTIEMIGGLALMAGGLAIAFGSVGAAIALLVGGFAMAGLAILEWIKTGELGAGACAVLVTGIMAIGLAVGLLIGSWIPLVVTTVISAVLAIIAYWDEIKEAFNAVKEFIVEKWNDIKRKFDEAPAWMKAIISAVVRFATGGFGDIIKSLVNLWNNWSETFKAIRDVMTDSTMTAKEKVVAILQILWEKVKNTFTSLGSVIGSAISGAVKTAINSVLSLVQSKINSAVGLINGAIGVINKLPGVSVGYLSYVSLPRLARGGVVNNPGRGVPAVIGEAGAEAVLPLERNTGWMDTLADKIASRSGASGQIVVPVYLSGRKIAEYIVDLTTREAFVTNRA